MIRDLKSLYVLNVIEPTVVFIGDSLKNEETEILKNRICRKEISEEQKVIYRDLEMNNIYEVSNQIGNVRVEENSIVPLSYYYNILGIPNINFSNNTTNVRFKVKKLKKQNRL